MQTTQHHGASGTRLLSALIAAVVVGLSLTASAAVAGAASTPTATAAQSARAVPAHLDAPATGGTVTCVSTISGVTYTVVASLGGVVTLGGFQPDALTGTCTMSGANPAGGEVVVASGLGALVGVDGFENDGTIAFEGDDVEMSDSGTFTNAGTLLDEAPGFSQSFSIVDLVNTGTIEAVEPSGASEGPSLGLVDGASGASPNELDDQGIVSADAGGSIDVEDGTFVLEPTGTVTAGPGSFGVGAGGTLEVQGGTVTGGDVGEDLYLGTCIQTIEFGADVSPSSSGTIAGSCPVGLDGTVPAGWTLDANGSVTAAPGAGNDGTIVENGDNSTFSSSGTFTNAGTFLDESAGYTQSLSVAGLVNSGSLSAMTAPGQSNGPSLVLADGTGDRFENEGTLTAGTGSVVSVTDGTLQLDEGSSTVAGPGSLGLGTGGSLVVDGGVVAGGSIQTFEFLGTCASGIAFASSVPGDSSGSIDNVCPLTLTGSIASGWTLATTASFTAAAGSGNDGTLELEGNSDVSDAGTFTNAGLLESGGGDAAMDAASFTCAPGGEVDVTSYDLGFSTTPTNLVNGTLTGCTWIATGRLALGQFVTTLDADVTESGTGALTDGSSDALSRLAAIEAGGAVRELGGAELTVSGALTNHGIVQLASTSSLTVPDALVESSTASLRTAIGTSGAGAVHVGGAASIDGDLEVALDAGASPSLGATYDAVTAASSTGTFATQELASLRAPDFLSVAYRDDAVELQVVDQPQTAVALGSSGSPSEFGAPITLTATVAGSDGGGTVGFFDGDAPIAACATQLLVGGAATCVLDDEAVGTHTFTATYSGDTSVAGSTSGGLDQVVQPTPTSTGLTSSDDPSPLGADVTLAATVTGGDGGGTVAFDDGETAVPGCATKPITAEVATCVLPDPALGTHSITATYSGDTDAQGSSSSAFDAVVDQVTGVIDTSSMTSAGPIGGGDELTITGTGFTGATEVSFVDAACTGDPGAVSASVGAAHLAIGEAGTTISLESPGDVTDASNACAGIGLVTDVVVASTTDASQLATFAPGDEFTFTLPQVASVLDATTGGAAGPVLGGEQVTISGSGFTGASEVQFLDGACTGDPGAVSATVSASALDVSPDGTSITLSSPGDPLDVANACPGEGGIATDVVVTVGPSGPDAVTSPVTVADAFSFELPVVAGIVDTDATFQGGPIVGGNELVVYGSGLTGATRVVFTVAGKVVATVPVSAGGSDSGVPVTAPDLASLVPQLAKGATNLTAKAFVELPDADAHGGVLESADGPYDGLVDELPVVTSVATAATGSTHGALTGGEPLVVHGTGLLGTLKVAFTYRDRAGATASVVVAASSNTEDGTTLTVTAPDLAALVGISGATAVPIAKGERDVVTQLRVIQVNPSTAAAYEGTASGPGDDFSFAVPSKHAPRFTSPARLAATRGVHLSSTVTSSGWPNAKVTIASHPRWLTLRSLGNGTATLSGTPTKAGDVTVTLTASNGVGAKAVQHLVLVVAS